MKSRVDRAILSGSPTSIVITVTLPEALRLRSHLTLLTQGCHLGDDQPVVQRELFARIEEAENPLRNAGRF